MTIIVLLMLVMVAGAIGFVAGNSKRPEGALTRAERKELNRSRNLIGDLTSMAGEHAVLGDAFAVLTQIKINDYRKELNR